MLRRLGDDIDFPSAAPDREQLGGGRQIVVPEIVMDDLPVPESLSGARVQRQEAVPKQVLAVPVRSVEVVSGRPGGNERDSALLVDRHLTPVVHAARGRQRFRGPRIRAKFTPARDRVENPFQLPGDDVEGVDVSGRGTRRTPRSPAGA